jgi:hypothetical protein
VRVVLDVFRYREDDMLGYVRSLRHCVSIPVSELYKKAPERFRIQGQAGLGPGG